LAGHVVSVSQTSCVVVLLTDATVSIGGRLEGAGEIGFVTGKGSESEMDFQLLDPYGALEVGDRVVTFGSKGGRPFVPGVPIGQIVAVSGTPGQLTRMATLRPYVNPSTVNIVGVVLEPPRENPRDAVLMDKSTGVLIPRSLPIPAVGQATPEPTGSAAPNDAPTVTDSPSTPVVPAPTVTKPAEPTTRAPTGDGAVPAGGAAQASQ
jgi:rod shape-determining protein MreC